MAAERILAVDDEPRILELCSEVLQGAGYQVETAADGDTALGRLREACFDLMLTDLRMPGTDGMALVQAAGRLSPRLPVVVITGYPAVQEAVDAVRHGAAEVIAKPFDTRDLCRVVQRTLATPAESGGTGRPPRALLGDSKAMAGLREMLARAAATDSTVLIQGESGTGKELVARNLHWHSPRREGPFVVVDGATLQVRLLERETGDRGLRPEHDLNAIVGAAHHGSLFIDDVDDLPPHLQSRLLRLMDEGAVAAPAAGAPGRWPRFLAASRADLRQGVEAGRFREDLYFRLNVIPLQVPPLRQRSADVKVLALHVREEFGRLHQGPLARLTPGCLEALASYPWPGNVRELRNVVERMLSLADGHEVTVDDIPAEVMAVVASAAATPRADGGESFRDAKRRTVARFERDYVHRILDENDGNVTRSAMAAGLNRSAFQRLMRKHGLRSRAYRAQSRESRA